MEICSSRFSELHSALLFPNPFSLRAKLCMKMCGLDSALCFCPGYLSCFERIKSTALSWDASLRGRIKQCEICGFRDGRSAQPISPRCLTWQQFNKIIYGAFICVHRQTRRRTQIHTNVCTVHNSHTCYVSKAISYYILKFIYCTLFTPGSTESAVLTSSKTQNYVCLLGLPLQHL